MISLIISSCGLEGAPVDSVVGHTQQSILVLSQYAIAVVLAAAATYLAERHINARARFWLVVALALSSMFAGLVWYAWPVALALNSDASTPLRDLAAMISVGVSGSRSTRWVRMAFPIKPYEPIQKTGYGEV